MSKTSKTIADVNLERKKLNGTLKNTVSMFPVGTRVRIICVAQDFYFFKGDETGVVTEAGTDNASGMIIVKFDEPRHFQGGHVQKEFNFEPDDLVVIEKSGTNCPHCGKSLVICKAKD